MQDEIDRLRLLVKTAGLNGAAGDAVIANTKQPLGGLF